ARSVAIAGAPMLIGAAIQISNVIFWPLCLNGSRRPSKTIASIILCAGIAVALMGPDLFQVTVAQVASVAPAWLEAKLAFYPNYLEAVKVSMGAALLFFWDAGVLLVLYRHDSLDPFVNIALWLTLYMLAAHLFFSTYPTVWNRLLAVALPWQVAAIWRSEPFKARFILFKGAVVVSIGAFGIA